jgi:P-type E1-E2 ATPase
VFPVAEQIGIRPDDVMAGCLPENKGNLVAKIRNELDDNTKGVKKVAFVGDGINDSVALAEAHVG